MKKRLVADQCDRKETKATRRELTLDSRQQVVISIRLFSTALKNRFPDRNRSNFGIQREVSRTCKLFCVNGFVFFGFNKLAFCRQTR